MQRKNGEKPNIVLIEADQMTGLVLPIYDPKAQAITPHLTALAEEGLLFENAYCNSPLCTPSRASMFSGSRTTTNEVWGNGSELTADTPTMMHFLKSAGYRTVCSGKTHFVGPDQLHGFDYRLTTDMYPANFGWSIDWKPKVDYRPGTSVTRIDVPPVCRTTNQILYDEEVQFRAIEFLRYEALEPKDDPFFLHVSFTQPHDPYQTEPKFWELYDDIDIAPPAMPMEADADAHPVTRWLKHHHGIDQFPPTPEMVIAARRAYYAMITQIDAYVGEIVARLKQLGLYDDTIIVFCSDHGDMMGERGMWFKRTFYEQSSKVPLIIHNPKRYAPKRVSEVVSLADLCPTFAEIAGAKAESDRFGSKDSHSFAPLLAGPMPDWKDQAIIEYFGPGVEEPWLAIRKGPLKYIHTRNHDPLLFDVAADPGETTNLMAERSDEAARLHHLLFEGIDLEERTATAIASKQTRVFLHKVMAGSPGYRWDYQPEFDAAERYVRGPNVPIYA